MRITAIALNTNASFVCFSPSRVLCFLLRSIEYRLAVLLQGYILPNSHYVATHRLLRRYGCDSRLRIICKAWFQSDWTWLTQMKWSCIRCSCVRANLPVGWKAFITRGCSTVLFEICEYAKYAKYAPHWDAWIKNKLDASFPRQLRHVTMSYTLLKERKVFVLNSTYLKSFSFI